jgi:hypothetical protein
MADMDSSYSVPVVSVSSSSVLRMSAAMGDAEMGSSGLAGGVSNSRAARFSLGEFSPFRSRRPMKGVVGAEKLESLRPLNSCGPEGMSIGSSERMMRIADSPTPASEEGLTRDESEELWELVKVIPGTAGADAGTNRGTGSGDGEERLRWIRALVEPSLVVGAPDTGASIVLGVNAG